MIITGLSARNVLKYSQLDLSELPENGLIAVEGANESGKSSIGEMICFVLFGRTYSLSEGELTRLIKWGELSCAVTLQFMTRDRVDYEVTRFLDNDGNQSARLNRVDAEHDPLARGTEQVQVNLNALIGYNYEEFIESFYLAQREITTPHPHSHAVKAMAGLSVLERLSERYGDEIRVEEELAAESRQQTEVLAEELEVLAIEPGKLEGLLSRHETLTVTRDSLHQQVRQLEQANASYQELLPRYREACASRGRIGLLRFLALLITLLFGIAAGMVFGIPEHELSIRLAEFLGERQSWIIYGAIVGAGLSLWFWWQASVKVRQVEALHSSCATIAEPMQVLGLDADQEAGEQASPDGKEAAAPVNGGASTTEEGAGQGIHERMTAFKVEAAALRQAVDTRIESIDVDLRGYKQNIDHLGQQIQVEHKRVEQANGLLRARKDLENRVEEHDHRIAMRLLAQDLLLGATRHFSQVFNRNLRELVGRTLPLLTEQRYEYLQIDEDLAVRVFSKEKRDFVKLEELSSGTQRQIMLALRLALSQELVNKAVKGKQFLFLDEPFAFFDQERTRNALSVLPRLSDEITQIWVVAQEFPADFQFDQVVNCSRDQSTLQVQAADDT